jgi:hypothetical protein
MAGEFLKIELDISGQLKAYIENPNKVKELFSNEMTRAAKSAGAIGLSSIKIGTPISKIRHPHLIDQEYFGIVQTGAFKQVSEWFTEVFYAPFVEARRHMFEGGLAKVQPQIILEHEKAAERIAKKLG